MNDAATIERADPNLAAARHKLTVADFHRMAEAGILDEDDRVELIEGGLFDMPPIGSRHAGTVAILTELFSADARGRRVVFVQNPVQIPDYNEPVPDLALLKPRADSYRNALPQPPDVVLVVEVADSSISRDRDVKIPIYGSSGIPEAWLVDVQRRVITVYRQPSADGYQSTTEVTSGSLKPECVPDVVVALSELFG